MKRLLPLLLVTLLSLSASPLFAEQAVIGCSYRSDFNACFLCPENAETCNFATLSRGLTVEILGRCSNGRIRVRVPYPHPSVMAHEGWPGSDGPVGTVNPDFLLSGNGAGDDGGDVAATAGGTLGGWNDTAAAGDDGDGEDVPDLAAAASAEAAATHGWNGFPRRSSEFMTGSQFLAATNGVGAAERERAIVQEIVKGNVPSHLRHFVEIDLGSGATAYALPGVLAIGSDADFVRIPMTPGAAQRICNALGASLPTRKLSDLIYRQAANKARPRPLSPGPQMSSNDYYARANRLVDQELSGRDLNRLTAGTKKDIIIHNRLASNPGRVCIYGWHTGVDNAIQPVSTVHGASYVDYSHGVRLISSKVMVNGQETTMRNVLTSSSLARLVSNEGPLQVTSY